MRVGIGTNNVAITEEGVLMDLLLVILYVSIWETVQCITGGYLSAVLMTLKVAISFATTATDVTITHAEIACPMQ